MGALSKEKEQEFEAAAATLMVNGSTNADAERVLAELRRNDVSWKNLAKGWKLDNLVQVL